MIVLGFLLGSLLASVLILLFISAATSRLTPRPPRRIGYIEYDEVIMPIETVELRDGQMFVNGVIDAPAPGWEWPSGDVTVRLIGIDGSLVVAFPEHVPGGKATGGRIILHQPFTLEWNAP